MSDIKELKSIELSSYTIISTAIAVLFSILASIVIIGAVAILSPQGISIAGHIASTIIVGAFIWTIYSSFSQGLFYNLLAKKLNGINFKITENTITDVSAIKTATITSIIITIQIILIYLATILIFPLLMNALIDTLMFAGQEALAFSIYQFLTVILQPVTTVIIIVAAFVLTFVITLIATLIYNIIAKKGKGVAVELSKENGLTAIDSINPLKFGIAFGIVGGIINLIFAVILLVNGTSIADIIINIISGFVGIFIDCVIFAIFYNYLASKLSKLKLELND